MARKQLKFLYLPSIGYALSNSELPTHMNVSEGWFRSVSLLRSLECAWLLDS